MFDGRGLVSVRDRVINRTINFRHESCFVLADEHALDTGGLRPASVEKEASSLTYTYNENDVTLKAVYELKPGWRFVSKQLFLTHRDHETTRVKGVQVFRAQVVNPVAYEHRVDRGWKGIWAGLLRFVGTADTDPGYGAFFLLQNPFMKWSRYYQDVSLSYEPQMDWGSDYGPFASDRACIGIYPLSGTEYPARAVPADREVRSGPCRRYVRR